MRKSTLSTALAALAAGFGGATFVTLAGVPGGVARARPGYLLREVFFDPGFWTALIVCTLVAAAVIVFGGRVLAFARGLDVGDGRWILEPLAWGSAAPIMALALDPWWFHSTAGPLAAAGMGLGLIAALQRASLLSAVPERPRLSQRNLLIGLVALAILIPTAMVLPGPPWWHSLSGDEPHYLVVAGSLWIDGDVDIANDYAEQRYLPYFPGDLSPHTKAGSDPATRYSIHGAGLSAWLAPWLALGQRFSAYGLTLTVRFSMILWLAALTAVLFLLLRDIAGRRAATLGTLAAVFTAPLLFHGPHLFTEVPAMTLSAAAYLILRRRPGWKGALFAGLLLACLPWLHFKYLALMATVATCGAWWLLRRPGGRAAAPAVGEPDGRAAERRQLVGSAAGSAVALALPLLLTVLAHVFYTWSLYGRLSPVAIAIGANPEVRATAMGDNYLAYFAQPLGAVRTGIGHLLDQKEGLLFYAPHYLLAIAGLAWLWIRRRADAVALVLCLLSLWGPYALSQVLGHWAPPARPLTAVLWTLAVPMGIGLALSAGPGKTGRWRSALRGLLVASAIAMTVLLVVQSDLIYHDYNISKSLLLQRYGAPGLPLWSLAPLWVYYEQPQWAVSVLWLAIVVAAGVVLWRWGREVGRADEICGAPGGAKVGGGQDGRGRDADAGEEGAAGQGSPAFTAARLVVVLGACALLIHHSSVPVTYLHAPHGNGPTRVWIPVSPRQRAWPSSAGTWFGGADTVELLLSSPRPLALVTARVGATVRMEVEVQLGRDRQQIRVMAGDETLARWSPGPGRRWQHEYFYPLRVVSPDGAAPIALGTDPNDGRVLGIRLEVVEIR